MTMDSHAGHSSGEQDVAEKADQNHALKQLTALSKVPQFLPPGPAIDARKIMAAQHPMHPWCL
jgi:hypothetical protein